MNSGPVDSTEPTTEGAQTAPLADFSEPDGIGPFRRRNTPSVAGYMAAALIALVIGSVLVTAAFGGPRNAADFYMGVWLVLVVGSFVVLVLGLPLTVAAHFALRRVRPQSVHVATFGGVGLLTGTLVGLVLDPGSLSPLVILAVGASSAAGRAVVNHRPR